jgi:hypothetical protein
MVLCDAGKSDVHVKGCVGANELEVNHSKLPPVSNLAHSIIGLCYYQMAAVLPNERYCLAQGVTMQHI